MNFEMIEIPDIRNKGVLGAEKLKEAERTEIEKYIDRDAVVVALDENGREFSSLAFSEFLEKKMVSGNRQLVFIIGGAFGISSDFLDNCTDKISLSLMTFSHQMARLIFIEQLYRGFTIIKNEKYHHK